MSLLEVRSPPWLGLARCAHVPRQYCGRKLSRPVFISYRRDPDAAYVDRLADYLQERQVPVWFDREIISGDRWHRVIQDHLDNASALLVVMSRHSEASRWVAREITRAEELDKPIFPILLEGACFFRLNDLQSEDVTGGQMPSSSLVAKLRIIADGDLAQSGHRRSVGRRDEFDVILDAAGDKKIQVIQVVRELVMSARNELPGLKETKDLVESAPTIILEQINRAAADRAKTRLEEAGAKVSLTRTRPRAG